MRIQNKFHHFFHMPILNQSITPTATVRNLDVTFDSDFNLPHTSPSRLYHYISLSVTKTIDTVLITSRLDYCNSLLYNIASNSKGILKASVCSELLS